MNTSKRRLTRREALAFLAALGITGPAAKQVLAQARKQVSIDTLRTANAIIDHDFTEERLQVIATAFQRNLDQFQMFRDLEIDDSIEPAPIFLARGRV
ncbi:MAG: hypothetical protein HY646_06500 [Acidobacteria bacterium]|nr:hypothetical protein [Acidobacteriota bacterium]